MRTTVTIDPDTEFLLKEEVQRTGRSFKVVLNAAIRRALLSPESTREEVAPIEPLVNKPFPAEWEGRSFNQLADDLDDEETLKELGE